MIANSDRRVIAIPNNVSLIFLVNMARFDFLMINEDLKSSFVANGALLDF